MKIIHGSLSGLLGEVTAHGPDDGVRVAALMQSTVEGAGMPRYTSWVIVSGRVAGEQWAEWRLVVGRQRAEITEHGVRVPAKLAAPHGGATRRGAGLDRDGGARDARGHRRRGRRDARGGPGLVRASGPRPAGADNDLGWRRTIDEHLELRRITHPRVRDVHLARHQGRSAHGPGPHELARPGAADRAHRQPCRETLPTPPAQGLHRRSPHRGARRVLVELTIRPFLPADDVDRACPDEGAMAGRA